MNCGSCSVEVPVDARFCQQCGFALVEASPTGRLFDSSRQATSDEDAEARAWETLKPHLEAAKRFNSETILTDSEWNARCLTFAWGSVPKVRGMTPFNQIVNALVNGREQYADVRLVELEDLALKWSIAVFAPGEKIHPPSEWRLTIDPDGQRIKPSEMTGTLFSACFRFDGDLFEHLARPITVALWRGPGEKELRYAFRENMR